jgi:hypothetical protein
MAGVSAVTLDALLELVGGQVVHELGEDSLSGIYPPIVGNPCCRWPTVHG